MPNTFDVKIWHFSFAHLSSSLPFIQLRMDYGREEERRQDACFRPQLLLVLCGSSEPPFSSSVKPHQPDLLTNFCVNSVSLSWINVGSVLRCTDARLCVCLTAGVSRALWVAAGVRPKLVCSGRESQSMFSRVGNGLI